MDEVVDPAVEAEYTADPPAAVPPKSDEVAKEVVFLREIRRAQLKAHGHEGQEETDTRAMYCPVTTNAAHFKALADLLQSLAQQVQDKDAAIERLDRLALSFWAMSDEADLQLRKRKEAESEVQQLREVLARVRSIVSSWESEDNSFRDQILAALSGAPDEVRVAARPAPPANAASSSASRLTVEHRALLIERAAESKARFETVGIDAHLMGPFWSDGVLQLEAELRLVEERLQRVMRVHFAALKENQDCPGWWIAYDAALGKPLELDAERASEASRTSG